jgi:hypothetical protein
MLEKEKQRNGKRSGAGANCSDVIASGQNFHAARVAIAAEKIRHRDIVNLKQSVTSHAALQERHLTPMSRLRSKAGRVEDPPAAFAPSAKQSSDRLGPASNLNTERGGCTNSAQIRNALYVGASGCIGKFFSRL